MSRYVYVEDDAPAGRYEFVDEPAAVSAGKSLNSIPRQIGLTARYALEGPAQAAQIISEPMRNLITDPIARLFGAGPGKPLGQIAAGVADWAGLPKPESANERVVGDAARLVAGAGASMGAGSLAAKLPGLAGQAGAFLSAAPAQQLASAASAGAAAGASREAGGNELLQAGAGLVGGIAGGTLPGLASAASSLARRAVTPAWTNAQIDAQIGAALKTQDVDYAAIPERARQAMRTELRTSIQAGKELNPEALRRFADFKQAGLTPTRGMLTQDPVQITREMNLAKMGANSGDDQLHGLARLQNTNNTAAIGNLNDLGASRGDAFSVGQSAISAVRARDDQMAQGVTGLYNQARSMAGGDIPVDRAPIINNVFSELARENKMAFLPENIGKMLNDISAGQIKANGQTFDVPFNAQTVDTLKTMISTAQRGTQDGNVKAALAIARNAIDTAPFNVVKPQAAAVNPMMTGEMGAQLAARDAQPQAYMGALNEARTAAARRFGWQESSRPVEAALSGAEPDKFFQRFVVGGTAADTQAFVAQAGRQATQEAMLAHLKDRAISGAADEVGKFSQAGFNKALKAIGDQKLQAIFEPEQLAQLRALGRATSYAQAQPVGSAVNNSNSGALVLGRGADFLGSVAKKLPFGQSAIVDPLRNINISLSQRRAENVLPGLLAVQQPLPMGGGLLGTGLALGGLLAAPMVP